MENTNMDLNQLKKIILDIKSDMIKQFTNENINYNIVFDNGQNTDINIYQSNISFDIYDDCLSVLITKKADINNTVFRFHLSDSVIQLYYNKDKIDKIFKITVSKFINIINNYLKNN